jgi:hypothetical protein
MHRQAPEALKLQDSKTAARKKESTSTSFSRSFHTAWTEAVEKRVMRRGRRRAEFLGRDGRDAGLSIGACGFERGDQLLIAAINGSTPMIAITRFML